MTDDKCPVCGDTGAVAEGREDIDACPLCAEIAEQEWWDAKAYKKAQEDKDAA